MVFVYSDITYKNMINFALLSLLDEDSKEIVLNHFDFNLQNAFGYVVKFDANGKPIHPAKTEANWNLAMKKLYDIEYNKWRKS
jgi:hypothetical protein